MKTAKDIGILCVLAAATVLLSMGAQFLYTANQVAVNLPGQAQAEIDRTRTELQSEIHAGMTEIAVQVRDTRVQLLGQVAAINVGGKIDAALLMLDRHLSNIDSSVSDVSGAVVGIRGDLKPTLANVKSLTGHADEAAAVLFRRDALPAQTLGLIAATKVTMGEAAQTMKVVAAAAPKMSETAAKVGESAVGIAADVKREADDIVKPKRWYQKVLGPAYTAARLVALFL